MRTSKLINNLNNKTMKNLILITAFVFGIQTTAFSQNKINTDDLIGYWKPDEESSQLFFWKDVNGKLQVQEICGSTGEPIDLIRLKVTEYCVIIDTIFKPNEWVTRSEYYFIEPATLKCLVTGDSNATIFYKKIK
jgi:hypothetical protein